MTDPSPACSYCLAEGVSGGGCRRCGYDPDIERERDSALARVKELEAEMAELKEKVARVLTGDRRRTRHKCDKCERQLSGHIAVHVKCP